MPTFIGIDIGTTEIKMSVIDGVKVIDYRESSPKPKHMISKIANESEWIFFPLDVWNIVKKMLERYTQIHMASDVLISIVSHAPSYCIWNSPTESIGVPYLAYYGDSKSNNKHQRTWKSTQRENLLKELCQANKHYYISGLTGYIVYLLSGINTLDSITAWEIGIESQQDYNEWGERLDQFILPSLTSPTTRFPIKKGVIDHLSGEIIAGTTDTGVLPLTIAPKFCDYYVYLGTWGSLLRTKINKYSDYSKVFFEGQLHEWLISIPEFEKKIDINHEELVSFFKDLDVNIPYDSRIAICGGLTKKYSDIIEVLLSKYLCEREVVTVPMENNAIGAFRLGKLSIGDNYYD